MRERPAVREMNGSAQDSDPVAKHAFVAHSVFSDLRKDELASKLIDGFPVIRAWGVSPHLDPLIDRCIAKLTRIKAVRGLMKAGTTNKFLHPLPSLQSQQMLWVNRMVEQCQGKGVTGSSDFWGFPTPSSTDRHRSLAQTPAKGSLHFRQ